MADAPNSGITTEESLIEQIRELEGKLEERRSVEQAKGFLTELGLTEEEAYSRMRKASMFAPPSAAASEGGESWQITSFSR